ncbi:hypothetical protein [Sinorhizobium medicae]|uniref:hypothetical protein n=1 Tax=Sinorhizobium medicae TaxID=110321 RepID=UPI001AAF69F4|nr:hypothetical protein [Sinorhizobium medicae]MDW9359756.1 hypothetical protein [Sinorhizobium meliloti]MBO1965276.1 hypothetical protein [Sinorhizobium medicae]MDW9943731.1 hypothetical protein [Sinorhizobium meliloti]WQO56883.1 hypothetical protein U8C36_35530 [Sinorhizobium medicae]WQP41096.1 hypothetical protein U8C38_26510 [Sinorhizobium medicae]
MKLRNAHGCWAATLALAATAYLAPPATAGETASYKPPEFLYGVSAGDDYNRVLAQQGWYDCAAGLPRFRTLCFDQVSTLGETGTYRIKFLDGRAFSAELRIRDDGAMERMVGRLPEWKGGVQTLVLINTENAEIDMIKAVHSLGRDEALRRFSRYLDEDGRHQLESIEFVPLDPPAEIQFTNAEEYRDSLPPGGVIVRLWRLRGNVSAGFRGVSMLSLYLPKADRKDLFPQYCNESCAKWSLPEAKVGSQQN